MEFEKPSMQAWFVIAGFAILWFINSKAIDLSNILIDLSKIFITFPLILLTIFVISSLRKSIKKSYIEERELINKEIIELRKEQDKKGVSDDKLVEIDDKIAEIRRELLNYPDNRFEKMIVKSLILFVLTLAIFYLNLGIYVDINNNTLGTISFLWGSYYIAEMLKDLFHCF